jgi:prepilin-type N-terminal cleavage/methylation domain-containing protein
MDKPKNSRRTRSRGLGFTLIEVMISIAVLAFVLLAFLSIMTSASTLSMSSKEAMIAAFELQSAVEDVCSIQFTNLVGVGPQYILPNTGLSGPPPTFPPNAVNLYPRATLNVPYSFSSGSLYPPLVTPFVPQVNVNTPGVQTMSGGKYAALRNEALTFSWTAYDTQNLPDPTWVEFRIDITWTNFKGLQQTDTITTRRSR